MQLTYPVSTRRVFAVARGYTLLELVVVMALVATVFATMPIVGGGWLASAQFQQAEDDLLARIWTVRRDAMTEGIPQTLTQHALLDAGKTHGDHFVNFQVHVVEPIILYPNGASSGGVVTMRDTHHAVELRVSPFSTIAVVKIGESGESR